MPRKLRQLIKDLRGAGFIDRGGKGSHRNFEKDNCSPVTISGKTGADAKPYQEKLVSQALQEANDQKS